MTTCVHPCLSDLKHNSIVQSPATGLAIDPLCYPDAQESAMIGDLTFLPAYLPRVMMATRPTLRTVHDHQHTRNLICSSRRTLHGVCGFSSLDQRLESAQVSMDLGCADG